MNALRLITQDPILRLLAIAAFFTGSFTASIGPMQSVMAIRWFGMSDPAFAVMYVTGSTLSLVCAIGVGILTDQTGRRRNAARLAALAGFGGAALVWTTQSHWTFLAAHMVIFPLSATLFSQIFTLSRLAASHHGPADAAAILSAIRAILALPWLIILPLWSMAFEAGVPIISIYAGGALGVGIIAAIFVFAWPKDGQTRWQDGASGLSLRAALRELTQPAVISRVLLLIGVLMGVMVYLTLTGLILTGIEGRGTADVALFTALVAGFEVPFMLALRRPLLLLGRTRLIALGAVIHASFLILFPLIAETSLLWGLPVLAAMGAAVLLTQPMQYLQDLMASRPGAGGSLVAICNLGAQIAASAIFAAGTALGSYGTVAYLAAGLVVASGLSLIWLDRRDSTLM
ncbi:hypothetical protein [Palleronia caenipelagi]|uniref:MFS transporter n=1 Tax=Palleronia caenipelagi TaxID=2489174 RepID=A0A547Q5J6_9RHOB|nr:hypothetical protein [Palleronia caenipelagi]TRD21643.1 hypothetical protein FEV53_07820 [Palleronia caenipelagi]